MCLSEVFPNEKIIESGVGYKVFKKHNRDILPMYFYRYDQKRIILKKWINELEYRAAHHGGSRKKFIRDMHHVYPYGFHIFLTRYGAYKYKDRERERTVKKVKFRKGCAIGKQYGHGVVVVAKEIFV